MIDNDKIIRQGFTNIDGEHFSNIRETAFKKERDKCLRFGKFITETLKNNEFIDDLENGVYIFQSATNPNIAYRIYKEFAVPNFNGYSDDILISKLQERQKNIELTTFPYGVVTLDGKIIGQEIPFYDNSCNLYEYVYILKLKLQFDSYLNIINILKELEANGVFYLDGHYKNFMIDKTTGDINLIDFDKYLISFDKNDHMTQKKILTNLKNTILDLNPNLGKNNKILNDHEWSSLEEAEEKIYEFVLNQQVG